MTGIDVALSVVIPCYNGESSIAATVRALDSQEWVKPWEIVVADNASTDRTPEVLADLSREIPRLRVVRADERPGAAYARNTGVRRARGRAVAFFDADDTPHDGWVAAMGSALESNSFVACRLETESLNEPWTRAVRGTPQDTGLLPTNFPPYLPAASGGTMGIHRDVFLSVGGFDETLPLAGEDIEFAWRVQLAGHPLVFVPEAVVSMQYRHTLRETFEQARRYGYGQPIVYRRYRNIAPPDGDTPPSPPERRSSRVGHILSRFGELRDRNGRARWVWRLGWYWGNAQREVKRRVAGVE